MQLSPSDRTFMRHFAIMIAMLGGTAIVLMIIGSFVFMSLPKASRQSEIQMAGTRITPVSAVYTDASAVAAATPAASAPAASTAPSGPYAYDAAKGKTLFDSTCAACHQATGEGVPGSFPPLKGNQVVNDANPAQQIETILNGRQGTVIDGKTYPGAMPPFGGQLSDLQVADIANYERSSWGNRGKHLTPADVAKVRAGGK